MCTIRGTLTATTLALLFTGGCTSGNPSGNSPLIDNPSLIVDSVVGLLSAIGNDTEVFNFPAVNPTDCSLNQLSSCNVTTFAITSTWNSCTFTAPGGVSTLSGGWKLQFTSSTTCSQATLEIPSSGTFVKTSTKLGSFDYGAKLLRADGASLLTHTDSHTTYTGTSPGGGLTVIYAAGESRTIQINGIQRRFFRPDGVILFDHSMSSAWPHLSMTGRRTFPSGATTRVVNGTVTVLHNLLLTTATLSFNSLTWGTANCSFPSSGTITMNFTGSGTGTGIYTATGCGTGTYLAPSGEITNVILSFND